jgi:hypothetical protein
MDALAQGAFERRILSHVRQFFPRHVATLRDEGSLAAIREARAAAVALGFDQEREIVQFIDLSFMFGLNFHHMPEHPWAACILSDPGAQDAAQRMKELYDAAIAQLRRIAASSGPTG